MNFDEWVKKYEGGTWGYPAGSYVGECLSLTKWHIKEVHNINPPVSGCNGARCYWSLFPDPLGTVLKKVPYTTGLIPKKGWIAVWNANTGNGYGHIGSVISGTASGFVSLDQNWGGKHAHKVSHNFTDVYGFLIPKNESEDGSMNEIHTYLGVTNDTEAKAKLAEHLGETDNGTKCDWGNEAEGHGGHLGSARRKIKEQQTTIDRLNADVTDLQKQIDDHVCPIVPPVVPDDKWTPNGKTVSITDGNTVTTINYAVKQ